jgi:hypothetical protein
MTCQCGRIVDFIVLPSGCVVESCGCGKERALRGRTVEDIAREEAEFEARQFGSAVRREVRACEWPAGCPGFSTRMSTDYCPAHCEERRRTKNREGMRHRLHAAREKRAALHSTQPSEAA